jgi:2-amino-4-hydroxy-6-hydroxymethyldihydropteridine diphosphokinase
MVSSSGAEVKPRGGASDAAGWVVCALGSNQGDREGYLELARRRLPALGLPWTLASSVHETAPVGGPPDQPAFLNQVLAAPRAEVVLQPEALLSRLLRLEREAGRLRRKRWGPRTLDVDLLLFGEAVREGPDLTLPHPRMQQRGFVLKPLAEILPELVHPVTGRTVSEMLASLSTGAAPS